MERSGTYAHGDLHDHRLPGSHRLFHRVGDGDGAGRGVRDEPKGDGVLGADRGRAPVHTAHQAFPISENSCPKKKNLPYSM